MKPSAMVPFGSLLAVLLASTLPVNRAEAEERPARRSSTVATSKAKLIAVMLPAGNSNVQGTVVFEKFAGGTRVTARIGGLRPNAVHAIRIEGLRDVATPRSESSRDHLQAGDLGNLISDDKGNAIHVLDLEPRALGRDGILGLMVTVHENAGSGESPDKEAGDPIGTGLIRSAK